MGVQQRRRAARAAGYHLAALALACAACTPRGRCSGEYCGTIVFAAVGQPVTLLPPVTDEILDRDIFDQVFLRLADLGPGGNTIGDAGFEPRLADRWTWTDPLTLAFHLDPRARWQDGRPVRADDVAFTFAAYTDSSLDSPDRESLARIASVTAADSVTAVFRFRERYPEMFFDAVYHLRVLPAHLLRDLPFDRWRSAPFGRAPVGDGPYRLVRWTTGESLELEADSTFFLGRPHVRRLVWRFAGDLSVAVTQLLAGEADAIEALASPANIERVQASDRLRLVPYPSSVYTIVGFNLRARGAHAPHPVLGDPDVRRALVLATDRARMTRSVFGPYAKVPPVPIPQLWQSLWFPDLPVPPFDTAQAARLLESRGWRDADHDGARERGGRPLAFDLLVPSTSPPRRQYARLIQEALRAVGVAVTIEEVDGPTMQERLRTGDYDAAIESWANDPTPSSGIPQAWRRGAGSNFGGYASPAFERLLDRALAAATAGDAARAWKAALEVLSRDAPAIVLCAPDNVAAVDRRIADVRLRPDEYWAYVRTWRIPPDRFIARDRAER